MASEFDELVVHLLYLLAVHDGLSHDDLAQSIKEFYASRYDLDSEPTPEPQAKDLLFSDEPPPVKPNIDAAFVDNVWDWLCKHKDVIVNDQSSDLPPNADQQADFPARDTGARLTTTNERIWQSIAGHGVDPTRIKNAELSLLRVIAKHGAKGIVQPELVRESGQDKRSVPKRTDALAASGYIVKRAIIASGTRTSILKLIKFADHSDQFPEAAAQPGRGVIYYDQWFDKVIDLLSKNNKIIVLDDLRVGLGINQNTHETRALNRCIRRIIRTGCVRRLKARVAGKTPGEAGSKLNCLQMLRDATDADRRAFSQQSTKKKTAPNRTAGIHLASDPPQLKVNDEEADEGDDDDADGEEEVEVRIGEGGTLQTVDTNAPSRIPPQWIPDLHITNFLFDLIDNAGPTGLGTMEIHHRGLGPAWRRPVDELLIRLCDQWEISQPPHLKHLSILKDTAMRQRTHYFLYRTRAMFEEAVEAGHTFWEAIQTENNPRGKKKANADHGGTQPVLNAWGFPVLPAKIFAGNQDGTATLDVCEAFARPHVKGLGRARNTARVTTSTAVDERTTDTASQAAVDLLQQTAYMHDHVSRKRSAETFSQSATDHAQKRAKHDDEPNTDTITTPSTSVSMLADVPTTVLPAAPPRNDAQTRKQRPDVPILEIDQSGEHDDENVVDTSVQTRTTTSTSKVLLNPPGALRMKLDHLPVHKGRPKKHLIAVFRLPSLISKSWFVSDSIELPTARPKRKTAATEGDARPIRSVRRRVIDDDHDAQNETLPNVSTQHDILHRTTNTADGIASSLTPRDTPARDVPVTPKALEVPPRHSFGTEGHAANHEEAVFEASVQQTTQTGTERPSTKSATNILLHPEHELAVSEATVERIENPSTGANKRHGLKASGAIVIKRTKVVMDIISKCGGVYPGNREIHQPMSAALKQFLGTSIDSVTVDNTIKDLVLRGKLRKLVFQFYDSQSLVVRRAILTEPHIPPNSPAVLDLKNKIQQAYPAKYLPSLVHGRNDVVQTQDNIARSSSERQHTAPYGHGMAGNWQYKENQQDGRQIGQQRSKVHDPVTLVQRTEAGLEVAAQRRRELIAKLRSARPASTTSTPSRRPRVRHVSFNFASDEDTDNEDIDAEQAQRMSKFQVDDYNPAFAHALDPEPAFRSLHPRKAFVSSFQRHTIENRGTSVVYNGDFSRTGRKVHKEPSLPWYNLSSATLHATATKLKQDRYDIARERSMQLMMTPAQEYHSSSGTFATTMLRLIESIEAKTSAPIRYNFTHYGWAERADKSDRARMKPVHRLQSLGSRIAGNRLIGSPFAGLQAMSGQYFPRSSFQAGVYARQPMQQIDLNGLTSFPRSNSLSTFGSSSLARFKGILSGNQEESFYRTPSSAIVDDDFEFDQASKVTKKRDRRGPKLFRESDRLANAVALYRTVLGGLDQRHNWGIIAHMLGFRYEPDFLRRRWDVMKTAREEEVRSAMAAIYDPFLQAYEQGEIPSINFDDLAKTDWMAMLEWLEGVVLTPDKLLDARDQCLPQSLEDFNMAYTVIEPAVFWEHSRDSWFTSLVEKTRKDIAHEFVYGTALYKQDRPTQDPGQDETAVLRSLIRAVTITKSDQYITADAARRIGAFDTAQISAVSDEMLADKTLRHLNKGRQQPGRNYEIHDTTWSAFRRWPGKETEWMYLRQVAAARIHIIDVFDSQDTVTLGSQAPDWEIVVLANMLRQGLLRITSQLPERNDDFEAPFPKLSAWGYAGYTYNAKTLDKSRLRFPVVLEKSVELDHDHGLTPGVDIPLRPAAGSKYDDGRLPFWVDIHGNLAADIWDMVLRSVLHLVVFRTGITANGIADGHSQRLLAWEIALVLEWMKQSSIAETCGPGDIVDGLWTGGWKANEWWYCAFSPEMITWDSPTIG